MARRFLGAVAALCAVGCSHLGSANAQRTQPSPTDAAQGAVGAKPTPAPIAPPPAGAATATPTPVASGAPAAGVPTFFLSPNPKGHVEMIAAIDGATSDLRMTMFHLTETAAVDALINAAKRGVKVRIILDFLGLQTQSRADIATKLRAAGVAVKASSAFFSISHVKAMTIDSHLALITTMNLTTTAAKTRDYGVSTTDAGIIAEIEAVFEGDWKNADDTTGVTPTLTRPDLVWSPNNARDRLKALIDGATTTIIGSTENLGDPIITAALASAVTRKVTVRLIVPLCDENPNPLYNVPFVTSLRGKGIDAKMMPPPAEVAHPYMHAKMLVIDGKRAFVGSTNFSSNSTHLARELGIVTEEATVVKGLTTAFTTDWAVSVEPPATPPTCPATI